MHTLRRSKDLLLVSSNFLHGPHDLASTVGYGHARCENLKIENIILKFQIWMWLEVWEFGLVFWIYNQTTNLDQRRRRGWCRCRHCEHRGGCSLQQSVVSTKSVHTTQWRWHSSSTDCIILIPGRHVHDVWRFSKNENTFLACSF